MSLLERETFYTIQNALARFFLVDSGGTGNALGTGPRSRAIY
jgi:hypothetical protein